MQTSGAKLPLHTSKVFVHRVLECSPFQIAFSGSQLLLFCKQYLTSHPPPWLGRFDVQSDSIMASVSNSARKSPAAATKPPQLNAMKVCLQNATLLFFYAGHSIPSIFSFNGIHSQYFICSIRACPSTKACQEGLQDCVAALFQCLLLIVTAQVNIQVLNAYSINVCI